MEINLTEGLRKKSKIPIKLKIERVILGDVLPYETPIIFSNRHFYDFLTENRIKGEYKIEDGKNKPKIIYHGSSGAIKEVIGFFNCEETIPFSYKISHKENDFRILSLIHPSNQIEVVKFYDEYKEVILYYTGISNFSIRYPNKKSSLTTFHDTVNLMINDDNEEHEIIEEFGREYKNLKTFFSYEKYSNIYKFYESYPFHQAEKKYNFLMKFDVSKCFDSIYTHSISWAVTSRDVIKDGKNRSIPNFGGKFDSLMQRLNHSETNGIVIGPEFSRIFAEIILQRIDRDVEKTLKDEFELVNKLDYEIFRYVDDFFVFCNTKVIEEQILKTYRIHLKEFKLSINENKTEYYQKPIITQITMAKNKIANLLGDRLNVEIQDFVEGKEDEKNINPKYSIYVSSNRLITDIKTIIKETNTSYKDLLNFTLAVVDRRTLSILKKYIKFIKKYPEEKEKSEKKLVETLLAILDVTFFMYSVAPRVNTTIKLSIILVKIIKFSKNNKRINYENQHVVLKKIFDEVSQVLGKKLNRKYTQVETIYLILILSELGREYRLNEKKLAEYFDINYDDELEVYSANYTLNYWSITLLLFYIKDIKRYKKLRKFITNHILKDRFKAVKKEKRKPDTELTILLLDLISCPYLSLEYKRKLLYCFDVRLNEDRDEIIKLRKYWFIKWTNFNLEKELNSKRSKEVY